MKTIGLIIFIYFAFSSALHAGDIFIWTDESDLKHITDTPPPQKNSVKLIEQSTYKNDSPAEIRTSQAKQKQQPGAQQSSGQGSGAGPAGETNRLPDKRLEAAIEAAASIMPKLQQEKGKESSRTLSPKQK